MKKLSTIFIILVTIMSLGCATTGVNKPLDVGKITQAAQIILDALAAAKEKPFPPVTPPTTPPVTPPVTPTVPPGTPHEFAMVNLLEKDLFAGQQLNAKYFDDLETFAKAGPTQLILFDLSLLPAVANKAGFPGRDNVIYYCFASTYADNPWNPVAEEPDSLILSNNRQAFYEWADRYIFRILKIAQNAPQTTIVIISNDGEDRLGARLYPPVKKRLEELGIRVTPGIIHPCPGC